MPLVPVIPPPAPPIPLQALDTDPPPPPPPPATNHIATLLEDKVFKVPVTVDICVAPPPPPPPLLPVYVVPFPPTTT